MSNELILTNNKLIEQLLNSIDITIKDDTTIITFKKDVIIQGKGNIIIYNPDGVNIIKSKSLHLNPKENSNPVDNPLEFVEKTLKSVEYSTRERKINHLLGIGEHHGCNHNH